MQETGKPQGWCPNGDTCTYCQNRDRVRWSWTCEPCGARLVAARNRFTSASARFLAPLWRGRNCVECGLEAQGLDHIVPLAYGGADVPGNLQPMCKSCNSAKHAFVDVSHGTQLAML